MSYTETCTHHHSRPLQWRIEICLGHVVQIIVHSHADGTHALQLYQTQSECCVSTCILLSYPFHVMHSAPHVTVTSSH